ncbi:MAG: hypothetical protein IPP94_12595 [Ignavibacteria bacterium]|nr:hypothetical protein [Ignavibacteria bacterium]
MGTVVVLVIVFALLLAAAMPLLRFNRKRTGIMRSAARATDEQLECVYLAIESTSAVPPTCAVLARTNRKSDGPSRVPIPPYAVIWGGRTVVITAGDEPSFELADDGVTEAVLVGGVYRILAVPRHQTKSGTSRNTFAPSSYLTGNTALLEALRAVDAGHPAELLAYLLSAGRDSFEFDAMFQARIGGSASWVQGPVFLSCATCGKRLQLGLQLPGSLLPGKPRPSATYYLFGCAAHPDELQTVEQFD